MTPAELVFIGQIAPERARGEDVSAQTRAVLDRLIAVLAERGLILEDLLRLRLFVRDLDDQLAIERAVDSLLATKRPALSVIELPTDPALGAAITLDAVAAPGARAQRRLGAHSARLGPWVFLGAISGIASAHGSSERRLIHEQSRASFARMRELLNEQGAELRDIVKIGGWLSFPMRDYGPLAEVRERLLCQASLMPASASVQVARAHAGEGLLAFEAIAFAPEDDAERGCGEEPTPAPSRLARFYADARSAGGYVFTSGEVPDGRGPVRTQAHEVYERLRAHLAAYGTSPADVVQQTTFVRSASAGAHIAEATREFYGAGAPLPPTTLLSVADIGFHPECEVEVELVARIAHSDRRRA